MTVAITRLEHSASDLRAAAAETLRMTRLQPRPVHPKKDLEAEVAFEKTLLNW